VKVRVLLEPPQGPIISRGRRSLSLDRLRWLFLLVGVMAAGYAGYAYLDTHVYQAYEDWSFDREVAGQTTSVAAFIREQVPLKTVAMASSTPGPGVEESAPKTAETAGKGKTTPKAKVAAAAKAQPAAKRDPKMIGRIAIPRLRVRAVVKEGIDDKTLRRAVGHVPETVRPGVPGNVGLAGHRDSFFRGLRNVRKDDRIVLETLDGKYEYTVESMKIVMPTDVHVLAPTEESILTLVTCYPFNFVGNAPKRYIVRARQVSAEPLETASTENPAATKGVD
jgi:LPXTG-site transpeptidase (sortase) family protein